jgi:hypothetical protein
MALLRDTFQEIEQAISDFISNGNQRIHSTVRAQVRTQYRSEGRYISGSYQ